MTPGDRCQSGGCGPRPSPPGLPAGCHPPCPSRDLRQQTTSSAEDPGRCALVGLQIPPPNLPAHDGDGPADSGTVLARSSGPGPDAERRARGMWSNQSPFQSEELR